MSTTINIFKHDPSAVEYQEGHVLFETGDVGESMFVVQSGSVDIVVNDLVVENAKAGAIFGELSLIDNAPRSAKVIIAESGTKLVELNMTQFMLHVRATPMFAIQVMKILADRLRSMNNKV